MLIVMTSLPVLLRCSVKILFIECLSPMRPHMAMVVKSNDKTIRVRGHIRPYEAKTAFLYLNVPQTIKLYELYFDL